MSESREGTAPAEVHKFIPFRQRLRESFTGWDRQEVTAVDLDKIAQQARDVFTSTTFSDVMQEFDQLRFVDGRIDSGFPYYFDPEPGCQEFMVKAFESFKIEAGQYIREHDLQNETITDFYHRVNNRGYEKSPPFESKLCGLLSDMKFGYELHSWLKEALSSSDPKLQARAIYLAYAIENPFLFIPDKIQHYVSERYETLVEKLPEQVIGDEQARKTVLDRVGYFLVEERHSALSKKINAWGYCQETARAYFNLLKDPQIGASLFLDTIHFAQRQSVVFPPQFFYIFERIREMYPQSQTYEEALTIFYSDHPQGLAEFFKEGLNYSVIGLNRIEENLTFYNKLPIEGAYVALFSGPTIVAQMEAKKAGCSVCITTDQVDEQHLQSMKEGGVGLFVENELFYGQKRENILVLQTPVVNIQHQHIVARLPTESAKLEVVLPAKVKAFTDKRGSLLYLQGDALLQHLYWLFTSAQKYPNVVIYLSKGISRWMYNDLILQVHKDGSMEMVDGTSSIPIRDTKFFTSDYSLIADFGANPKYFMPELAEIFGFETVDKFFSHVFPGSNSDHKLSDLIEDLWQSLDEINNVKKWMATYAHEAHNVRNAVEYLTILTQEGEKKARDFLNKIVEISHYSPVKKFFGNLLRLIDFRTYKRLISFYLGTRKATTVLQGILPEMSDSYEDEPFP